MQIYNNDIRYFSETVKHIIDAVIDVDNYTEAVVTQILLSNMQPYNTTGVVLGRTVIGDVIVTPIVDIPVWNTTPIQYMGTTYHSNTGVLAQLVVTLHYKSAISTSNYNSVVI